MPVHVTRFENQPIVLADYYGQVTIQDLITSFQETVRLTENVEGRVYRVADFRGVSTTFAEIVAAADYVQNTAPGATNNPGIYSTVVGVADWLKMGLDLAKRRSFGNIDLPLFPTTDEALHHIYSVKLNCDNFLTHFDLQPSQKRLS